jgi:hypothetical protein
MLRDRSVVPAVLLGRAFGLARCQIREPQPGVKCSGGLMRPRGTEI